MSNEPEQFDFEDLNVVSSLLAGKEPSTKTEQIETVEDSTPENEEDVAPKEDVSEEVDLDEDQSDEENLEDGEDVKPAKKVNRFQERINELTAKAREAERQVADLQRKLEEAATKPKQLSDQQPTNASAVVDAGPKPDDLNEDGTPKYDLGEFDPDYIRDLTRFTIQAEQKAAKELAEKERQAQEETEARNALQAKWSEKLTPMLDQHDDFVEKTLELETAFDDLDPAYSDYLVQTIKSLDHGPEVLYYFANNIEEAQKFVKLGPQAATLALGEYNALFKGAERKEVKVSKAPPPPQINKGTATRKVVTADTDDLDAFENLFFAKKK